MGGLLLRVLLFILLILSCCDALQRGSSSLDGRRVSLSSSNGLVQNKNSSRDVGERIHSLVSGDKSIIIRGGEVISQPQRRKLVVMLVAMALFNDMLQLTMLLPIIHTLGKFNHMCCFYFKSSFSYLLACH